MDLRTLALMAEGWLRVEAARSYGFIEGGPEVNVERCLEAIAEAKQAGVSYSEDDVDKVLITVAMVATGC